MKKSGMNVFLLLIAAAVTGRAAGQERPNILFVIADDMSHTSCYGYKFVQTPNFDRLAAEGLRFTHMYTPSSKCAPSRSVILTGRNPWQLEGAANHKPVWPLKFKSFVEALTEAGYFTGFTGKGWNPGVHPPGRHLTGTEYNRIKVKEKRPAKVSDFDYAANFDQFMADRPGDQPFFFWYGAKEPHRGYEFKSGVKAGKRFEDLDFLPSFWPDTDDVKNDILDYALEVEYFDRHLGKILQTLEDAGELENTLIVATSDNAMPFPRYKGHPHEFATRLPFVVRWPGHIQKPGRVCTDFASFIDIAPTLLEAADVVPQQHGMQPIQGKSLFDFFAGQVTGRDHVLTGRERNDMCRPNGWGYPVRSLHRGSYVYMHNFEPDRWPCGTPEAGWRDTDWGPTKAWIVYKEPDSTDYALCFGKRPGEELYDISKDPECLNNLAANPEYAALKQRMKKELFEELEKQKDPRTLGNGAIFDHYRPERVKEYDDLVKQFQHKQPRAKTTTKEKRR